MAPARRANNWWPGNTQVSFLLIPLLVWMLAGCATVPPEPEESTPVVEASQEEPDQPIVEGKPLVETQGIEDTPVITVSSLENKDSFELARQADGASEGFAVELRLLAIDGFVRDEDYFNADIQAAKLTDTFLHQDQQNQFALQRARIDIGLGNAAEAVERLRPLAENRLYIPTNAPRFCNCSPTPSSTLGGASIPW